MPHRLPILFFLLPSLALAGVPAPADIDHYWRVNNKDHVLHNLDDRTEGDAIFEALRDCDSFEPFSPTAELSSQASVPCYSLRAKELGEMFHFVEFLPGIETETGAPVWGIAVEHNNGAGTFTRDPLRLAPPDVAAILQPHLDAWNAADHPPFAAPDADLSSWETLRFSDEGVSIPRPPFGGSLWLRCNFFLDFGPQAESSIHRYYAITLPIFQGHSDIFFNGVHVDSADAPLREHTIPYAYGPLCPGTNTLAIRLDFSSPDADFIPFSPSDFALLVTDCQLAEVGNAFFMNNIPFSPLPLDGPWKCLVLPAPPSPEPAP